MNTKLFEQSILLTDQKGYIIFCDENSKLLLADEDLLGKHIDIIIQNINEDISYVNTQLIKNENFNEVIECYIFDIPHGDTARISLSKMHKILDNSYDEIFVIDNKGMVVYVNKACERNYGLKPSDLIGKTVVNLVEEGYYGPLLTPVVFKNKKRVTLEQATIMGKKMVVTATPILDKEGNVELVVMNSRDINEIVELKCDLEETKQLVQKYKQEVDELRKKEYEIKNLIVNSRNMKDCVELAQRVASTDSTILILGESGTGKNVMAKYIHSVSHRKSGPLKTINCAALPDQLLESELFGYTRGAFTGANPTGKVGLLELSEGGTLFLDEIAEIPLALQAKLLEVIQESRYTPIGATSYKTIDTRIIAATNKDLEQMVKEGLFREDLYYRLNVIDLDIPPLRERLEDIVPLAHYFLNIYDKKYGMSHYFSQDSLDILSNHPWPGNVRELQHVIERLAITVMEAQILPEHFPKSFRRNEKPKWHFNLPDLVPLDVIEEEMIIRAYKQLGSSYKVAEALNISQSKANRRIREYLNGKDR